MKANSARRRAASAWMAVEASNASDCGALAQDVLLNKHGRRVIRRTKKWPVAPPPPPPPPHIPLFPTSDLEDPRLVAYG